METPPATPTALIPLGRTNVMVSPMGTGTWAWGDRLVWGYGRNYDAGDVAAAFEASVAAGVTFFDTAELYGLGVSERLLGTLASTSKTPVTLATKFFPFPWRVARGTLRAALGRSLARLGVPCVDLYQVHWPLRPRSIETWAAELADVVHAGLARAVGVSNYNGEEVRRAHAVLARHGVPLASNQVHYCLLHRIRERDGTFDACRELGVSVIAHSPLDRGLLTGKYGPNAPPPRRRRLPTSRERLAQLGPLLELLRRTAEAHGRTSAQAAINWSMRKGAIPIPGAKTARQATENAGALGWSLSDAEMAALDGASDQVQGAVRLVMR